MIRKPPCKKDGIPCPRRCPGCQDHCEELAKFQAAVREDTQRRREQMMIDGFLSEQGARRKMRPDSKINRRRDTE